jgi:chemotaxis protein MotB
MLIALANFDVVKVAAASISFQESFGGSIFKESPSAIALPQVIVPRMGGDEQRKKMALQAAVRVAEAAKGSDMKDAVKVKVTDTGIAIKISDPILFEIGQAEISPSFREFLGKLVAIINADDKAEIRVEGHTDNTPISTPLFASNWELSSSRALNVVKFFQNNYHVDPARLSGVGYGEYRPIVPNDTPENRQKNRRIEIYVEYLQKKDADSQ